MNEISNDADLQENMSPSGDGLVSEEKTSARKRLPHTMLIAGVGVAALIIGILGGAAIGFNIRSAEISEVQAEAIERVAKANRDASSALANMQEKVRASEKEMSEREQALFDQAAKLEERESKVAAAEDQKASRELRDGFHTVGRTIEPGVYHTTITSGMCYYAWKSGTDSAARIIDNNIVETGPATISLSAGEFIEIKGCGTWTRD